MLAGGVALCLAGLALGEGARFHVGAISTRSLLAMLYLVFAGSIVAFSAYNWLLHASTPARAGTYAFVNPIVAVFLGWAFAGEALGPNTFVAALFILAGVVLIIFSRMRGQNGATAPDSPPAGAPTGPPETRLRQHPEQVAPGTSGVVETPRT